jgi:hypothetical protein
MDELMSRTSRLKALRQLVEYATTESRELALAPLEGLLHAAALAIDDALAEEARRIPAARRYARIRLVTSGDLAARPDTARKDDSGLIGRSSDQR